MGGGYSVLTSDAATQTHHDDVTQTHHDDVTKPAAAAAAREGVVEEAGVKQQILQSFTSEQMKEMVTLYKERLVAIDRSSIKCTVQAKRDLYNSLSPTTGPSKPRLDHALLHRQNHPKGYLTKITTDYEAKHDEEITVHKGTMVKVLRNHKDGRYEVYTAGGFGLVPGKVLAYIQYEPDYT